MNSGGGGSWPAFHMFLELSSSNSLYMHSIKKKYFAEVFIHLINISFPVNFILSVHLQVSVPPGALDCWVFLSCLEVLQRIEGCCDRAQVDANVSHTVGLWSYATEKVSNDCVAAVVFQF